MRLLVINPFNRTVKSEYVEILKGIINFHVQSSQLSLMPLGQEHLLYFDHEWWRRIDQSYWRLKAAPDTVLGGKAVITGKPENMEDMVANCGLNPEHVAQQLEWVERDEAESNPVVVEMMAMLRRIPKEVISRYSEGSSLQ